MASGTKRAWKLQEFVAHGATVNCLSIGRKSGRVMVTGGEDKKVNLWAVGKPNCIMSLTGHTTPVECVKFCHTEEIVCAGSMSGALKIWDLEAAKIVRTLTGHKANVRCIDFHPYGDFIASGSVDNTIKLWDIRRKGCIYTYKGHSKCVNSLKFSPDGRWIASGSEDGSVKLWDIPAGRMLAEFHDHSGPVNDVDFHPNEFLLASGSSDRTVKFWDLESLQLVSSAEGDSGIVRCIYFNPDGDCLFSGADDVLKVYSWEPVQTFDTLIMGWNKVADISASQQNQLIAGAFCLTNVSVYVVDLKRVYPFGGAPNTAPEYIRRNPFQTGSHNRRSFSKEKPNKDFGLMHMKPVNENESNALDSDPGDADIKAVEDYNEIFHPSREYLIKPFESQEKLKMVGAPSSVFCEGKAFGSMSSTRTLSTSSSLSSVTSMNSTYTVRSQNANSTTNFVESKSTTASKSISGYTASVQNTGTVLISPTKGHQRSIPMAPISVTVTTLPNANLVKPMEKATAVVRNSQMMETSTVSIVRPVMSVMPDSKEAPQKAVVYPEQQRKLPLDFVPSQPETPVGLDLDEFLPRHLQESLRLGGSSQPEMPDSEAIAIIHQQHKKIMTVLAHRLKNIKIVLAQWSTKDPKMALETAFQMNDQSVIVDILNVITLRPQLWNLDLCQIFLPAIYDLLQNKYELYMSIGCSSLKLILKNFGSIIKTNITAPPGIGVDISREERYNKCMSCYNQLLSIRAFLLKRQTLQGKLGQSFRELHILMQSLE